MIHLEFMRKYPTLAAARVRSDSELIADLDGVTRLIAADPESAESVRVSVVRDWIAQALSLRHRWGIDAAIA